MVESLGSVFVRMYLATTTAVMASLITSCAMPDAYLGDRACFYLEVVNPAAGPVAVLIFIKKQRFYMPAAPADRQWSIDSGNITLQSGGRRIFEVCAFGSVDSGDDNVNLRHFGGIRLYRADNMARFGSYTYELVGCGDGGTVTSCDDAALIYRRSDGVMDRLFVESPSRPFYLERERWDRDIGRLVITFAPNGR